MSLSKKGVQPLKPMKTKNIKVLKKYSSFKYKLLHINIKQQPTPNRLPNIFNYHFLETENDKKTQNNS